MRQGGRREIGTQREKNKSRKRKTEGQTSKTVMSRANEGETWKSTGWERQGEGKGCREEGKGGERRREKEILQTSFMQPGTQHPLQAPSSCQPHLNIFDCSHGKCFASHRSSPFSECCTHRSGPDSSCFKIG